MDGISKYEIVFVLVCGFVLVKNLIYPIVKRNFCEVDILKCLCGFAVASLLYSIMTYGQLNIDSDTASATLLAKSQMENHTLFPATWNYANGDLWVISTNIFVLPFVALLKNQVAARMLGSALFCVVTFLAIRFASKEYEKDCYLIIIPLIFLCMRETYIMLLYQAAYVGPLLWIVLCPVVLYRAVIKDTKKQYLLLNIVLMVVLSMAGIRNLAEIVLPLWGSAIIFEYVNINKNNINKKLGTRCAKISVAILVPAIIGCGINQWLCSWHNMNNTELNRIVFSNSVDQCFINIGILFKNLFITFGYNGGKELISMEGICNMISITLCILIIFIIPILQIKKLKEESKFVNYAFWFMIVHNMIMIIMAVLFDKVTTRYIYTSIFCTTLVSSRYIMKYFIKQINYRKFIWIGLFGFVIMFESITLLSYSRGWRTEVMQKREITAELQKRGLNKGYATYWNAYNNQIYSDSHIIFGGIYLQEDAVTPMLWLVDGKVFEKEEKNSFLLLTQSENENLSKEVSSKIHDNAIDIYANDKYVVYIYDYDIKGQIQ